MIKSGTWQIRGLSKDTSISKASNNFLFDARNIRLNTIDDSTLLSICNEKGNLELNILGLDEGKLQGILIGSCILKSSVIIFTTCINSNAPFKDYIYKLYWVDNDLHGKILYKGDINFSVENPIETLSFEDFEERQNVYWVDGINPLRKINTSASDSEIIKWSQNSDSFNQSPTINSLGNIKIERDDNNTSGEFEAGCIQFLCTYTINNKETPVIYDSGILYITERNKGAETNDRIHTTFKLSYKDLDSNATHLNIYGLFRSSAIGSWACYKVKTLPLSGFPTDEYDETYISSMLETYDYNNLTIGLTGDSIIASTIAQKDNTLFLGDVKITNMNVPDSIINLIRRLNIKFEASKKVQMEDFVTGSDAAKSNQLRQTDREIKTFKYLEWYRFGIKFQYNTGKLSSIFWIGDFQNTTPIYNEDYTDSEYWLVQAKLDSDTAEYRALIDFCKSNNIIGIKPMVVYTNPYVDSECICQGVANPTLYLSKYREKNSVGPYAISSWFFRPVPPYRVDRITARGPKTQSEYDEKCWRSDVGNLHVDSNTEFGVMMDLKGSNFLSQDYSVRKYKSKYGTPINGAYYAADNYNYIGGIIPNRGSLSTFEYDNCEVPLMNRISQFAVDNNTLTFHSPEIELKLDEYKFIEQENLGIRIIGVVPLTSYTTDIIVNHTPISRTYNIEGFGKISDGYYVDQRPSESKEVLHRTSRYECKGTNDIFFKGDNNRPTIGRFGCDSLYSRGGNGKYPVTNILHAWKTPCAVPGYFKYDESKSDLNIRAYVIYPWQRSKSMSLVGTKPKEVDEGELPPDIINRKLYSNFRVSKKSMYLPLNEIVTYPYDMDGNSILGDGVFDIKIIDKIQDDQDIQDDSFNYDAYLSINKSTTEVVNKTGYSANIHLEVIETTSSDNLIDYKVAYLEDHKASVAKGPEFNGVYKEIKDMFDASQGAVFQYEIPENTEDNKLVPIPIKFKSGRHAVVALKPGYKGLPANQAMFEMSGSVYPKLQDVKNEELIPELVKYANENIAQNETPGTGCPTGFLWLTELYRTNVQNRFGGTNESALIDNNWMDCGPTAPINDTVVWNEGDTYYQRYEHLKTYEVLPTDYQSVREAISFMVETRINLDGRTSNTWATDDTTKNTINKYNVINHNYTQSNDINTSTVLDERIVQKSNVFKNAIIWSISKNQSSLTDEWLNINGSSMLNLDSSRGRVTKIESINNDLIIFQERGISKLMYNNNIMVNNTAGIPLEVVNSGKVTGSAYISNFGVQNKWSIKQGLNGIYFIDDYSSNMFLFGGEGFTNLTDKFGLKSWLSNINSDYVWNPKDFNNGITFNSRNTGDILFTYNKECIAFNETLGQFVSFYNYENTQLIVDFNKDCLAFKYNSSIDGTSVYLQNKGDYNMFFGEYKPFSVTFIANHEPTVDKTFTGIEFRADSWKLVNGKYVLIDYFNDKKYPFDTLQVYNEYQDGAVSLKDEPNKPSPLKRKFRIWRANIPRNLANNRDRIRNTWAYIKLSKNEKNTDKTVLHDVIVNYLA